MVVVASFGSCRHPIACRILICFWPYLLLSALFPGINPSVCIESIDCFCPYQDWTVSSCSVLHQLVFTSQHSSSTTINTHSSIQSFLYSHPVPTTEYITSNSRPHDGALPPTLDIQDQFPTTNTSPRRRRSEPTSTPRPSNPTAPRPTGTQPPQLHEPIR